MWRHPILTVLLLTYIVWGGANWYANRPLHQADGVLAADEPQQVDVASGGTVQMGRWTLTVRASYQLTARVLGRERYHFDSMADLAPEDLALGWGPMSDNRVLQTLEISQANRFYYWRITKATVISRQSVIAHSANTHVIPQNPGIAAALRRLRPGTIVTLRGELVDAVRNDGRWVKTSLVREDTGAGACEIMLVTDVES